MVLTKGTYKCHGASTYVRVLKIYYQDKERVTAKLSFEYKNGLVIEVKSYRSIKLKNIQHWRKVFNIK